MKKLFAMLTAITMLTGSLSVLSASAKDIRIPNIKPVTEQVPPVTEHFILGDVNQNGEVTLDDLALLVDYVKSDLKSYYEKWELEIMDVTQDGTVDFSDVEMLEEYFNTPGSTLPEKDIVLERYIPAQVFYLEDDFGDVNCDGIFSELDYIAIEKALFGSETLTAEQTANADFNQNGELDAEDFVEAYKCICRAEGMHTFDYEENERPLVKVEPRYQSTEGMIPNGTRRYLAGDVKSDGIISVDDVWTLIQYLDGSVELTKYQIERADANQDGYVTYEDAVCVEWYVSQYAEAPAVTVDLYVYPEELEAIKKIQESHKTLGVSVEDVLENFGDVNMDGSINAKDAADILIYCAELGSGTVDESKAETLKANGDINADSIINASDAANILTYSSSNGIGLDVAITDFMFDEKEEKPAEYVTTQVIVRGIMGNTVLVENVAKYSCMFTIPASVVPAGVKVGDTLDVQNNGFIVETYPEMFDKIYEITPSLNCMAMNVVVDEIDDVKILTHEAGRPYQYYIYFGDLSEAVKATAANLKVGDAIEVVWDGSVLECEPMIFGQIYKIAESKNCTMRATVDEITDNGIKVKDEKTQELYFIEGGKSYGTFKVGDTLDIVFSGEFKDNTPKELYSVFYMAPCQ